uniref:cardiolipin synthase (CMP-forming) n=1 Tax=Cacopsylla melanoneura TaxID=428564 RepID=A0A8D8Y8X4_9HEMI
MALYVSHLKLFQARHFVNKCHGLKYFNYHIKSRPITWLFKKYNVNKNNQLSILSMPYLISQNNSSSDNENNHNNIHCSKYNNKSSLARQKYKAVLHDKQEKIKSTSLKIKKQGKLILSDIKETKVKMKERMGQVIEKENIWTVPNLLCMSRICLSPMLCYFIVHGQFEYALVFVIVAGITDGLDGWIARTFKNQSTKLGSFLDPMADKVLIATLFLSLTYVELIPVYLTGLIILRDILLVGAGFYVRYISLPKPRTLSRYFDVSLATAQLAPTFISKCNTSVQLFLTFGTLGVSVFDMTEQTMPVMEAIWALTAFTTVASAISYIYARNTTYKILHTTKPKVKSKPNNSKVDGG